MTQSTTTLCIITLSGARGSVHVVGHRVGPGSYASLPTYGGSKNFKGASSGKERLTVAK